MKIKRTALNITSSLLAAISGVAASTCWQKITYRAVEKPSVAVMEHTRPPSELPVVPVAPPIDWVESEVILRGGRLKIVPDEVHLKSDRLRYDINVRYPQFVGPDERYFQNLNQRLRRLAVNHYRWPLNPSKEDLRSYEKRHPEAFNSVDFDYDIVLASDSLLSIYFVSYDYGIGAAHSVQTSYVVNYDLTSRRELKLSDVFKTNSKYLEFIARYCTGELLNKERSQPYIFGGELTPDAAVFQSWNVTANGIRFNFDACKVMACAEGDQQVEIPFNRLKPFLQPTIRTN